MKRKHRFALALMFWGVWALNLDPVPEELLGRTACIISHAIIAFGPSILFLVGNAILADD